MTRPNKYPYSRSQWDVTQSDIYTYGGEKVVTVRTRVNVFNGEVEEVIDDEKENRAPVSYPP